MLSFFETVQSNWVKARLIWSQRSPGDAVRTELLQAETELLAAQSHLDYYAAMVAYNTARVTRLRALDSRFNSHNDSMQALPPSVVPMTRKEH